MKYKVLIADNFEMYSIGLQVALNKVLGHYNLKEARDGIKAQKILDKGNIDLALVKAFLPKKSGLDVLVESYQKLPQTKFIVYSSEIQPSSFLHSKIGEYGATFSHGDSTSKEFEETIRAKLREIEKPKKYTWFFELIRSLSPKK